MALSRFSPFVSPFERVFERSLANVFNDMRGLERQMFAPLDNFSLRNIGGSEMIRKEDGSLAVSVDVSSFKPEELTVSLEGRNLLIRGSHLEEDTAKGTSSSRQFIRSYRIPDDVDAERLKSSLSDKGTLIIEAPNRNPPKNIPIEKLKQTTEKSD